MQSLHALMNFEEVAAAFSGLDRKELENFFVNGRYRDSAMVDKIMSLVSRGMSGEAGIQNRPVFENLLQSMLINESVYMPLLHAVIPAEIFGSMMYSELWVDPDSDEGKDGRSPSDRSIKVLMKLDVKNVGYFEMIILSKGNSVDLNLFYPEHLNAFRNEIRETVTTILTRNHLTVDNFLIDTAAVPKTISEVFPRIYERKTAINVVI
jgi:hypothetical protein